MLELPRFIGFIEGYSKSKERVYFRGMDGKTLFSSVDGTNMRLTNETLPDDITPAVTVPGKTRADVQNVPWTGELGHYSGTLKYI